MNNYQIVMDITKLGVVAYMIVIAFVDNAKTKNLYNPVLFVVWLVIGLLVLLLLDIVLGVVLLFALLLTFIVSSPSHSSSNHTTSTLPKKEMTMSKETYDNKDFCEAPLIKMEDSAKALEKYIEDDYLEKASEAGLIKENLDKQVEPLSANHMDIQGTNSVVFS
jgi:uncharacterized membrane protein